MQQNMIEKLRLANGWTQQDLANYSGLHIRTIQRAERGAAISRETAKCLGATLNVDHQLILQTVNKEKHHASEPPASSIIIKTPWYQLKRFLILSVIFIILNCITWYSHLSSAYWSAWVIVIWGVFVAERIIQTVWINKKQG